MRKVWIVALAIALGGLAMPRPAQARVDVSIGIGLPFPGVVVAPPYPVVVGPPVIVAPLPVAIAPPVVYSAPVYYRSYGPRPIYVAPGHPRGGPGWHRKHWRHRH
jgi:hypothetical protein